MILFDEIYIQKSEKYARGVNYGADEQCQLHKGVVCFMIINYPTNVSAFGHISAKYERGENALWVWMDDKPIYLFYDYVYLIKNVPNNVLAWKQVLFPPFICKELRRNNDAMVAGGQISGILSTASTTSILNAKLIFGPLQN